MNKKEWAQQLIEKMKKEGLSDKEITYIGSTIYSISRKAAGLVRKEMEPIK